MTPDNSNLQEEIEKSSSSWGSKEKCKWLWVSRRFKSYRGFELPGFDCTVKPVYNGHPWETARWQLYTGWPLYTGQLCRKNKGTENFGKLPGDRNIQCDRYIQGRVYDIKVGWFSNRTWTSFDEGKATGRRGTRLTVPNLSLCHWSSQLFDLRAPSSTDFSVLLLNQPKKKYWTWNGKQRNETSGPAPTSKNTETQISQRSAEKFICFLLISV